MTDTLEEPVGGTRNQEEPPRSVELLFQTLGLASQEERAKYRNLANAGKKIGSSWNVLTVSNATVDDVGQDDRDFTGRGHAKLE